MRGRRTPGSRAVGGDGRSRLFFFRNATTTKRCIPWIWMPAPALTCCVVRQTTWLREMEMILFPSISLTACRVWILLFHLQHALTPPDIFVKFAKGLNPPVEKSAKEHSTSGEFHTAKPPLFFLFSALPPRAASGTKGEILLTKGFSPSKYRTSFAITGTEFLGNPRLIHISECSPSVPNFSESGEKRGVGFEYVVLLACNSTPFFFAFFRSYFFGNSPHLPPFSSDFP